MAVPALPLPALKVAAKSLHGFSCFLAIKTTEARDACPHPLAQVGPQVSPKTTQEAVAAVVEYGNNAHAEPTEDLAQ